MERAHAWLALALVGCGATASSVRGAEDEEIECTAALRFEEPQAGAAPSADTPVAEPPPEPAESAEPRTAIRLVLICRGEAVRIAEAGTELGACFRAEAPPGALLGARCWWGSRGALLEVRRQGDVLGVRRERLGPEPSPSEEVARLEAPAGAWIRPLR